MDRPFLFLAGEYAASMPLVFSREHWQHTMSARPLEDRGGGAVGRDNVPSERLRGVLYFAGVDDERVRRANLSLLDLLAVPCWPDPSVLLRLDDRHRVMRACVASGLVDHDVQIVRPGEEIRIPRPFVLKTGNEHRGEGKHLIREGDGLPAWDGEATAEPFFEGVSARVLLIGERWFGLRYDNPTSWIKNSVGADVEAWDDIPNAAVAHAMRVRRRFGLEIAGIDYIIGADRAVHFLEYNQFPGLSATERIQEYARPFLATKLDYVEWMAGYP